MRIKPGLKVRRIGGENVVLLPSESRDRNFIILYLNATFIFLWISFSDREFEREDVSALLLAGYGIDSDVAVRNADSWITRMLEAGAIEL